MQAATVEAVTGQVAAHVNPAESVVQLHRVSATYSENGQVLPVLDDVSLEVRNGELVALLGPSGCGKSTALNIVAGLIEPNQGMVFLHQTETVARERLGMCAYMHQRDLLLPWRDALGNAALSLEVQGTSRKQAEVQARNEFRVFGLEGFEHRYPAQLSGGMKQRVAFVRTMVGGQPILLLDEPFGALDALTRTSAQDWLGEALRLEPRSTLLVTHDVEEAIFLSNRILVMSSRPGRIVSEVTVTASRPRSPDFRASAEFDQLRLALLDQLGVTSHRRAS